MRRRVAIVGIGCSGFSSTSTELSYREMIFEAAAKCYKDAGGIQPQEIDSFVSASKDFIEEVSRADDYKPDQLGATLKPVHSTTGDSIQAAGSAMLQIMGGQQNVVAVSAFSKVSSLSHSGRIASYAADPSYIRPLQENAFFIAGLEMNRYLHEAGATREQCAAVVVKNRSNALYNPLAAYGANISADDVTGAPPLCFPLCRYDVSGHLDGAIVILLAAEEQARQMSARPVWIKGLGWAANTPNICSRLEGMGAAVYGRRAAEKAYAMAGIRDPASEIDFAEIDDTFSYKELQHLEALGLCEPGEAGLLVEEGAFGPKGQLPVNLSGGSLGFGYLHEANGLFRIMEAVLQLRGEAGRRQLDGASTGLAFSWRGVPTAVGAAAVLSNRL